MSDVPEQETPKPDAELDAIHAVVMALEPLSEGARNRVIAYVFNRLGLENPAPSEQVRLIDQFMPSTPGSRPRSGLFAPDRFVDIRSLAAEKKPSTVQERVALVAFYLSELAPEPERKPELSATDLTKYLKQAGLPMPARARQALLDAKNAGYLDSGQRGTYKLNAVGYNLVAHRLPSTKTPE